MSEVCLISMIKVDSTYELIKDLQMDGKLFAGGLLFCCLDRGDDSCTLVLLQDIDNKIAISITTFEEFFVEK